MATLFTLKVFPRNLLRGNSRRKIFSHFVFTFGPLWPIRLTDFALPQHTLSGSSASCASIGYTIRWQGFLDLVFSNDTRLSSLRSSADTRTKYLFCWSIPLNANNMVESAQPLDIYMLHNVHAVEKLIQLTFE